MLQQDRVNTLRQTHSLVTTLMPIITAGLTVTGAVIATMEARRSASHPVEETNPSAPAATTAPLARARRGHGSPIRRYVATLAGRLLMVTLGIAIVLALTVLATSTGRVGQAIIVTALILLSLYLVEKVARQG